MERGIVTQIRNLAKDPQNRSAIVKDQGCLPGLVLFLDNKDVGVVDTSLEAMALLAECTDNKSIMWSELGLVVSVNNIVANTSLPEATRALARKVIDIITPRTEEKQDGWSATAKADAIKKISRLVTLQIKGLDDLYCRKQIEEQLLAIKGVVSFTFDMKIQRIDVRAKLDVSVESLCNAIAKTKTMSAVQIVRTEEGQEVVLSFGRAPAALADKENDSSANRKTLKYLDEDEIVPDATVAAKAVARVGDVGKGSGWLGSLGSYITKSLYW